MNMVRCKMVIKEKQIYWLDSLLQHDFFDKCIDHQDLRKNEKNGFCIDCHISFCRHCAKPHRLHRRLQICKYVYQDVVRVQDLQQYFDSSEIQTYKINGEKAVHLNSRAQLKDARPSTKSKPGAACETCGRYIQDFPNRFCSIACKVALVPVKPRYLSPRKIFLDKDFRNHRVKEPLNQEGSLEEKKSCVSWTDFSDESEALLSPFSFRPSKRLRKRKGTPCRSPLF